MAVLSDKHVRRKWKRIVAICLATSGLFIVILVALYYFYGIFATSKLEELVYPLPIESPIVTTLQKNIASNINPREIVIYPGLLLNPQYWDEPLWAGIDPIPLFELPLGFEMIEDTGFDSDIKKLGKATNINIPSIGLSSTIKELTILDLENSREYETPKNTIGHIPETGNPGELLSGWFFGHLESPIRGEGNVFKDLPRLASFLREGKPVFIVLDSIDGSFLYQAHTTNVVHNSELVVETHKDRSISLVSCVPKLVYDHRLIVQAKLIGIKKEQ